ncbi:MAG: helix-turn-helix transcriptional regulator [Hyphomonadaceae bacterium]|nr:helix-turn-helix transcriptional regulator [Hyphomonadaceae bacterium]
MASPVTGVSKAKRSQKATRRATSVDLEIGRRVKARRIEIGLAQEMLAATVGVTFQQVQKYEKGVNRISASMLLRICEALKVQPIAILPSEAMGVKSIAMLEDPVLADLAVIIMRLNDDGKRLLLATARTFSQDENLASKK